MITIKPIDILSEEMPTCIALEVHPEQRNYVADNATSLAQAYDENKNHAETGEGAIAVPYAVYENDQMVGFAMYGYFFPYIDEEDAYDNHNPVYFFWRLFIDKNHQRRGIGKEAVRQVMDIIKQKPQGDAPYCYTSYAPDNIGSKTTFANYGFEEDGRVIGGETVARYKI